jgi:hypothetical protein
MHAASASDGLPCGQGSLRLAAFEVVWISLIFFLYAGSPPPDAGESHYLVKAKHYWDPAWCAGDLFLESSDTHLGYYWALGWLTWWFSLERATWIMRAIVWGLLAAAWRRLSWAVIPRPLFSLLTAGLMLLLAEHFHWSKELVLRGGVEGKTVAYVGVLLALEAIVQNRWWAALLWAGAAGAFHVLVGGWTAVAISLAWLAAGRERPRLMSILPAAAGGLALALPGLIPSLMLLKPDDPGAASEAWRIYVFERLPHHLVFHRFPVWYQARHAALAGAWLVLTWMFWNAAGMRRLMLVIGGAAAIGLVGIAMDQGLVLWANVRGLSGEAYERLAAPLLRFYWFRVEDALLPIGVALGLALAIARLRIARPAWGEAATALAILAAGANLADACYWRARLGVSGAVVQQRATPDLRVNWWWEQPPTARPLRPFEVNPLTLSAREREAWWQDACRWIAASTPPDARFITPRLQQTFKWYAGRAEVATRKDLPQDPSSILAWREALGELYPNDSAHRRFDLAAFSDAELIRLAHKYDCQYIVVERRSGGRAIGLPRVYPLFREENPVFEVYRVPVGDVSGEW